MTSDVQKPWIHLTTLERLTCLARLSFGQTEGGSDFNPRELRCLEGKLGNAWTAELYVEDDNKVEGFVFAAHLMFNLIKGHCLIDGNKRIAWIALVDTLAGIGWMVESSDDDAEAFCLSLCERDDSTAVDVREWLSTSGRLAPFDPFLIGASNDAVEVRDGRA